MRKGKSSWRKGLTKGTDDRIAKSCKKISDSVKRSWKNELKRVDELINKIKQVMI